MAARAAGSRALASPVSDLWWALRLKQAPMRAAPSWPPHSARGVAAAIRHGTVKELLLSRPRYCHGVAIQQLLVRAVHKRAHSGVYNLAQRREHRQCDQYRK